MRADPELCLGPCGARAPEDARELYLQLMERLNEMKAYGMPLPDDLLQLEAALEAEFAAEKRSKS